MNPTDHGSLRILNARSNEDELCSILPDSWSCPDRNTIGVVSECKFPSKRTHHDFRPLLENNLRTFFATTKF